MVLNSIKCILNDIIWSLMSQVIFSQW